MMKLSFAINNFFAVFLAFGSVALYILGAQFFSSATSLFIEWTLMSLGSCSFSLIFFIDGYSLMFSGTVSVIASCVITFSKSYMSGEKPFYGFIA